MHVCMSVCVCVYAMYVFLVTVMCVCMHTTCLRMHTTHSCAMNQFQMMRHACTYILLVTYMRICMYVCMYVCNVCGYV